MRAVICSAMTVGAPRQSHTYYIAADEVAWDYVPSGRNQLTGKPFGADANVLPPEQRRYSAVLLVGCCTI
jgi:hypothetical protein